MLTGLQLGMTTVPEPTVPEPTVPESSVLVLQRDRTRTAPYKMVLVLVPVPESLVLVLQRENQNRNLYPRFYHGSSSMVLVPCGHPIGFSGIGGDCTTPLSMPVADSSRNRADLANGGRCDAGFSLQKGRSRKGCQDGHSSTSHESISKGQWERRLQTDIHMAKQALCEALSLDKTPPANNTNIPESMAPSASAPAETKPVLTLNPSFTNPPLKPSGYASSTENIARLLQNWMRKSPKSLAVVSETCTAQSLSCYSDNNPSVITGSSPSEGTASAMTPEGGLDSLLSFNSTTNSDVSQGQSVSVEEVANFRPENTVGGLFQDDENKPNLVVGSHQMPPLSFLEKWLLDDAGAVQGQEGIDLMDMSLGETADLF
ncbi:transcription factor MYB96-like [Coffea arabica]|uniref:Transcription factor MYB96-like n=1 Tax=Coffea arabica TaxID=13443 RepID=A0ABM4U1F1_COFAR